MNGGGHSDQAHRYRLSWAQALSKVFAIDITQCSRCGQQGMQLIAVLQDPRVLRAMLVSTERMPNAGLQRCRHGP